MSIAVALYDQLKRCFGDDVLTSDGVGIASNIKDASHRAISSYAEVPCSIIGRALVQRFELFRHKRQKETRAWNTRRGI